MRYRESFYKCGVTEDEAEQALKWDICYPIHDGPRGNKQLLYVGVTETGKLLEIGVEVDYEEEWAFHARKKASSKSKKCLERQLRRLGLRLY